MVVPLKWLFHVKRSVFKRQYWFKLTLKISLYLLVAVVGVVFLLSNIQVFLFSHPPRQIASDAYLNEKQINFQVVELTTSDELC